MREIKEILVTAPVAVTALTAAELDARGISDIRRFIDRLCVTTAA